MTRRHDPEADPQVAASRYLSYLLRHRPEDAGLTLDPHGWVDVDVLLRAVQRRGRPLTHAELDRLVAGSDKRRFELDPTSGAGGRIRAVQGHSVDVDLGLPPSEPPATLYHGTVERFLEAILHEGLRPGGRTHVHLSADPQTARAVGARRGRPVVLEVDADAAHRAGRVFLLAANGVWLTDHVPPECLSRLGPAPSSDGATDQL